MQGRAVALLSLIAALEQTLGAPASHALAAYDTALGVVAEHEQLIQRGTSVAVLRAKARLLALSGRHEEALVVLQSGLNAVEASVAGKPEVRLRHAVAIMVMKLDELIALDRMGQAAGLHSELGELVERLGLELAPLPRFVPSLGEEALAGAVAKVLCDAGTWDVFEGVATISASDAAARARRLYLTTDAWAIPTPSAVLSAASATVRAVADGYALLSLPRSDDDLRSLPLPPRANFERQQLLRRVGVVDWMQSYGVASTAFDESTKPDSEARGALEAQPQSGQPGNARDRVAQVLYLYDLLLLVSRNRHLQMALRSQEWVAGAVAHLRAAIEWQRRLAEEQVRDGQVNVAITCWLIAEAYFELTQADEEPSSLLVSRAPDLRNVLDPGARKWLSAQDLPLPDWCRELEDEAGATLPSE